MPIEAVERHSEAELREAFPVLREEVGLQEMRTRRGGPRVVVPAGLPVAGTDSSCRLGAA
jgi:hypothetical protein